MSTYVIPALPETEEVNYYLRERFWHMLEISALRLPPHSILSVVYFWFFAFGLGYYLLLLAYTVFLTAFDDINVALLVFSYMVILFVCFNVLFVVNFTRNELNFVFWDLSTLKPFEYTDPDFHKKRLAVRKLANFRLRVAVPVYIGSTVVFIMSRPSIDFFMGVNYPVTNGVNKNLPVPLWSPYDSGSSLSIFLFALFSQVVIGYMVGSIVVAGFYVNATGAIELIDEIHRTRNSMENMDDRVAYKLASKGISARKYGEEWQDACYECISESVVHHQVLCRAMFCYNIIAGNILTFLFGCGSIVLAMTLYQLVNPDVNLLTKAQFFVMGFAEVFIFGFICALGQRISDVSEDMHDSLFHCDWQNWNQKCKSALNIMQARTTMEFKLGARFMEITANIDTFATLLNSAYSYVNLLWAFQEEGS